jgi:creatinine amidohydrolase
MEGAYRHLRATGPVGFGWASEDLSVSGAMGNAASATPAAGREQTAFTARAFVALLQDVHHLPLHRLGSGRLA